MNDIQALEQTYNQPYSVQIQKYSDTSLITDCKKLQEWLKAQGIEPKGKVKLSEHKIQVWRCRIGRTSWNHGWSISEAICSAVKELEGMKNGADS